MFRSTLTCDYFSSVNSGLLLFCFEGKFRQQIVLHDLAPLDCTLQFCISLSWREPSALQVLDADHLSGSNFIKNLKKPEKYFCLFRK